MVKKSTIEAVLNKKILKGLKGFASALIIYPIAEHLEKRNIRGKRAELVSHYKLDFSERKQIAQNHLVDILLCAQHSVPYYKDLFKKIDFQPESLHRDISYLNELPYLTKDIIREQGERMLSQPLSEVRHHICKTGGSTGLSSFIYYSQEAADYAAAVTLFCRAKAGKEKHQDELHFACRFPDTCFHDQWTREDWKCLAMNRSNIFFDRLDDMGLKEIWQTLLERRPHLIHGHPSTIYALACYIERVHGKAKSFNIFEPSGELLTPYVRETIARVLQCKVVDRYGLAELGVMAYQLNANDDRLQLLDSEGWPETLQIEGAALDEQELVLTGFRNKLMPLIRYRTGDLAVIEHDSTGFFLRNLVGRIHDMVKINGIDHPTHHIQDMLDHRIGGIQEFQIDIRTSPTVLRVVPESNANVDDIRNKIQAYWPNGFDVHFVTHDAFVRVGRHAKFRHVVHP